MSIFKTEIVRTTAGGLCGRPVTWTIEADNQDLEALMALAINAIDNRLNAGHESDNYNRWRKLALRIADMVE